MPHLHLTLLGGFECRSAVGDRLHLPTRKVRALLAYLALRAGEAHGREKLAAMLWGGRPEAQARADLRKSLSRLRESLPDDARGQVGADSSHIGLRAEGLEVDVLRFESLAVDGTPETLERAALLYRGPLLDGFAACGEGFDEWLAQERRRLEERAYGVLQRLLDHYVVTGAIDRAIRVALRLLDADSLQESVHRTLIRLYMYQDRVGAALDQYRVCRDLLAEELGVAPEPETERLRAELSKVVPGDGRGAPLTRESDDVPERVDVFQAAADDRDRRRAELTGRPSIVVLPFVDATDRDLASIGEGLAEDIATELGRFREIDVIAPTTALAYRDAAVAPERIGVELGAAFAIEGGFRSSGDDLRITVRLVESGSGRQLWAERYDWQGADIFKIGDDIVGRIVGTLVRQIEDTRLAAARRSRPDDLAAYELWLRGTSTLKRPDLASIAEARDLFQRAIARDPHFARAYVGLAMAHLNEWACFTWNHWVFPKQEVLDLARKAVELDDRDQRAHCILGMAQLYARDYEGAGRRLSRALELNPNDADVLAHASVGMALLGEHERAVEVGRSALRLAPHRPEWHGTFVGEALFAARLYEEAIATMAPGPEALCNTPAFIAASYAHLGQSERCAAHRDTVHRHHRRQQARGLFPEDMSCVDWLLAMDPFRHAADAEHYADGLRKAGFT